MYKAIKVVGAVVVSVLVVLLLGVVFAYPVKWLVNYLISPSALLLVFGARSISVWQAWGLAALCSFLFKSPSSK